MVKPRPPSEKDKLFTELLYQTVLQTELKTMVLISMFIVVVMMIKMMIVMVLIMMVKYNVQEDEDNEVEDDCRLGNPPPLILQQEVNGVVR